MNLLIVIPAFNEERILKSNIETIVNFCQKNLTFDWKILIADNNSTDNTAIISQELSSQHEKVDYIFIPTKGKGIAIKTGWQNVKDFIPDVYCFMDADLATDIGSLPTLVEAIANGSDCAIGSRFDSGSKVKRTFLRSLFSQGYRFVAKGILKIKINDLPCGFKAINRRVFEDVVPQVKNEDWFFDSELIVMAEKNNFKITEVPVVWEDIRPQGDGSRVKILSLSLNYFRKIVDLKQRLKKI